MYIASLNVLSFHQSKVKNFICSSFPPCNSETNNVDFNFREDFWILLILDSLFLLFPWIHSFLTYPYLLPTPYLPLPFHLPSRYVPYTCLSLQISTYLLPYPCRSLPTPADPYLPLPTAYPSNPLPYFPLTISFSFIFFSYITPLHSSIYFTLRTDIHSKPCQSVNLHPPY